MQLLSSTMTDSEIKDKRLIEKMFAHLYQKGAQKGAQSLSTKIWISVEKGAQLMQLSKRTIQHKCNIGHFVTHKIHGNGGLQYEILLSSLPIEAQKLYWMEKAELHQPEEADIQEWQKEIARARYELIRRYNEYVLSHKEIGKVEAKRQFVNIFNKKALPELYNIIGEISYKTLERWNVILTNNGMDWFSLAPKWGKKRGKRKVSDEIAQIVIQCYNSPNRPKISEAIRDTRAICELRGIKCDANDMTLRRIIDDYQKLNADVTGFLRHGQKWLNDEMLPYIERDRSRIEVGDIIVADGHTLDFEIIDPETGRPKRMALILCYDMKSNMPLGWEIMPCENTQVICAAFRNTIIGLGFIPRVFYLDNGKAFRAKFFTQTDLEKAGFGGMFERLGSDVIYAWPYHGQSKTIERFFGTLGEIERKMPTYRGSSIEKKPARLNRGEKIHRQIYAEIGPHTPTIQEAVMIITEWFRQYSQREITSGPLKGKRPIDIFNQSIEKVRQQPDFQKRKITPEKLNYLMMETTSKSLTRNGIRLLGGYYYHEALYSFAKGNKIQFRVKYDIHNLNSIMVYYGDEFVCEARRTIQIHPAAAQLGTEADVQQLKAALEMKRRLQKSTVAKARELIAGTNLNWALPPNEEKPEIEPPKEPEIKLLTEADLPDNEPNPEDEIFLFETDKEYKNIQ